MLGVHGGRSLGLAPLLCACDGRFREQGAAADGSWGGLEIEKLAVRLGGRGVRWGCRDREINHRLGQFLVERDVPVWVVLFGECFEAEGLQLVEGGEALARGLFVAGMAESAEDVGVLVAGQAGGGS